MKHRLFKLALFLLLGVIVHVAVAWGCALWSAQESWLSDVDVDVPTSWPANLEELNWPAPSSASERLGLGVGEWSVGVSVLDYAGGDSDASWERSGPVDKVYVHLEVRRFGVPLRSLQWERYGINAGARSMEMLNASASNAGWRLGIDVSEQVGVLGAQRRLPLRPIWPGFAINTVFYSALLWLLTLAPFTVRRMIRRKRGRCIKCGYDLRGTSELGCPECGLGREAEA